MVFRGEWKVKMRERMCREAGEGIAPREKARVRNKAGESANFRASFPGHSFGDLQAVVRSRLTRFVRYVKNGAMDFRAARV
jgi:hypothetical protein